MHSIRPSTMAAKSIRTLYPLLHLFDNLYKKT